MLLQETVQRNACIHGAGRWITRKFVRKLLRHPDRERIADL